MAKKYKSNLSDYTLSELLDMKKQKERDMSTMVGKGYSNAIDYLKKLEKEIKKKKK